MCVDSPSSVKFTSETGAKIEWRINWEMKWIRGSEPRVPGPTGLPYQTPAGSVANLQPDCGQLPISSFGCCQTELHFHVQMINMLQSEIFTHFRNCMIIQSTSVQVVKASLSDCSFRFWKWKDHFTNVTPEHIRNNHDRRSCSWFHASACSAPLPGLSSEPRPDSNSVPGASIRDVQGYKCADNMQVKHMIESTANI